MMFHRHFAHLVCYFADFESPEPELRKDSRGETGVPPVETDETPVQASVISWTNVLCTPNSKSPIWLNNRPLPPAMRIGVK